MKYKKTSIFSLVLALSLIFGATTAFATSAQQEPDYRMTDEDGNTTAFDGRLMASARFSLDENGKYFYDPDDALDDLSAERSISPEELDNFDSFEFDVTPEGALNQHPDDLYDQPTRPMRTEAEMEQIIADIESGKIPGYKMSDFAEGRVPGFEPAEGAEFSFDFVDYSDGNCVLND